jgi:protein TonB
MAFAHYEAHTPIEESARKETSNRNLTLLLLLLLGVLFVWYRYNQTQSSEASLVGTTTITAASTVDKGSAADAAEGDTATSTAIAPRATTARVTPRSSAPVPIAGNPLPKYPISALRHGEGGEVVLQVRIDEKGQPIDVDVARRSGSRDLDRAAMQAVREWRFKPATRNGKPVSAVVELPVAFKPQG